jgi:hypothetical protein
MDATWATYFFPNFSQTRKTEATTTSRSIVADGSKRRKFNFKNGKNGQSIVSPLPTNYNHVTFASRRFTSNGFPLLSLILDSNNRKTALTAELFSRLEATTSYIHI